MSLRKPELDAWPNLGHDSLADKALRFGCGALLGGVVLVAGFLGTSLLGLSLLPIHLFPESALFVAIGLPLVFGIVSVLGGNRLVEVLARLIGKAA